MMEEFRRRVAALEFEPYPERVTCSVGLAAFPANDNNDVELMHEADQALYVAKSSGRNKVSLRLTDRRMVTKTSHYTATQLEQLAQQASLVAPQKSRGQLRQLLDDVLKKYNDQLGARPAQ